MGASRRNCDDAYLGILRGVLVIRCCFKGRGLLVQNHAKSAGARKLVDERDMNSVVMSKKESSATFI